MYFDYNATTPICPEAAEEISRSLFDAWGNPSSGYSTGKVAKAALDRHRTHVATDLKAAAEEITFMSGGTEVKVLGQDRQGQGNVSPIFRLITG